MTDAPHHDCSHGTPLPRGWWALGATCEGKIVVRLACGKCGHVEEVWKGLTDESPHCWLRCSSCSHTEQICLLAWIGGWGPKKP